MASGPQKPPPNVIPSAIHGQPTWDPNSGPPPTTRPLGSTQPAINPPALFKQVGSGGQTVVSTQALTNFAANIQQLIAPVDAVRTDLVNLQPVAAGAFDKAWGIAHAVTGGQGATGTPMRTSFSRVLLELSNGLGDLHTAATKMATTYTTTDSMNNMNVGDLQKLLDQPTTDFSSMDPSGGG
jgi:hypothetical protein